MDFLQYLKQDEVLAGYTSLGPSGSEKSVKGWLEICNISDYDLEIFYHSLISDIENLKSKYGLKIERLDRSYFKWELELYKKWKAVKIEKENLIVLADKKVQHSKTNIQWIPLTFYLINKLKTFYLESKSFEENQTAIIEKGLKAFEEEKELKYQKIKEDILKTLKNEVPDSIEKTTNTNETEDSDYIDVETLPL